METVFQTEGQIIFLRKRIETINFKVYVLFLFEIKSFVTKKEIIAYCRRKEVKHLFNATLCALVFFDNREYADFPKKPATYRYDLSEEEAVTKHLKAIYVSNIVNGFSKFFYYPSSYFHGEVEASYYLDDLRKI